MGEVAVDMGGAGDDLARESKKVQGLIFQMTTSVSSFKRAVDSLGTGKDTKELRGKLNKQRESIGRVAKECSLAVKRLAQSVTNSDDDGRTTHVAQHQKLVKDFHVVLKDFQRAQRTCAEREQGIQEIQQQIGEVNEIFQDLAVLVNEQGQMIDDIEANIVSTAVRTKDARRELTKADKSQKAARNKMICLAIVIAVVLIVLILFLLQ